MEVSRRIAPFGLRMPDELRAAVGQRAEAERRSMNTQIVVMLERSIAAEKAASNQVL